MANKNTMVGLATYARAALFGLAVAPLSAGAFTIDGSTLVGAEFLATWELQSGVVDGNGNTNVTGYDLTGSALFEFLGVTGSDTINLQITLTNTTVSNTEKIGLQKFGFATDPNAVVVGFAQFTDSPGDTDKVISADNNVSPEVQNSTSAVIDVETRTGTGANRSLQSAEFDVFTISLQYSPLNLAAGVKFSPFAVKYQSDAGSYEFPGGDDCIPGTPGCGGGGPSGGVPVPGTLALLGLGALLGRKRFLKPA